jgi:hypothetical protein
MDPAHFKRAGRWIPLILKELVDGSRSFEKSWSVDLAHSKRAGQWTPLIQKELVSEPRSSKKSWSVDPAHPKRAGQWIRSFHSSPLKELEAVIRLVG